MLCSPFSYIPQSQRTRFCLRINSTTQRCLTPCPTSRCWTAFRNYSLTTSSCAHRHRSYPHRKVPRCNPWWPPRLHYSSTLPLPTTSVINPFGPIKQRTRICPCRVLRHLQLTKSRQHCQNHPPILLSKGGDGETSQENTDTPSA